MALVKCSKCDTQFYGVDCPSCHAKGSGIPIHQENKTSPIAVIGIIGGIFSAVLVVFILLTLSTPPPKESPTTTLQSIEAPTAAITPKESSPKERPDISPKEPPRSVSRTPNSDEQMRMNEAMNKARLKLDSVIKTLGMSGDFVIKDRVYFRDGRITINLDIDLVSNDAKAAYSSKKLQNNTYPGFKKIYTDAMKEDGFGSASAYVNTNPFKY
jgi:hypothetical protein